MARVENLFLRYCDRGDLRALGAVFDRTADEALRVAMHFARDPVEAEEWVQQTYLTVIERAHSWDRSRAFVPWMLGILRNVVRRAHARRPQWPLPESPLAALPGRDRIDELEWSAAVAEAVEALDEPYRGALILRFLHGLEPAEIARLQRVPAGTVRSQIHRGLWQVRRSIARRHRPASLAALAAPVGLATVRANVLSVAGAVGTSAAVAAPLAGILTIGGLAVQKIALTLLAVAVLTMAILDPLHLWTDGPIGTDSAASRGSTILERGPGDGSGGDGAPVLDTTARPSGRIESGARQPYVVAGRVFLGWQVAAPGRRVVAAAYLGYEIRGEPVLEADLTSDAEGRFSWPMPPPKRPMRLRFSIPGTATSDKALALPDAPPPDGIRLYIRTRDARLTGRVTDVDGQPIDGAEVIYAHREPPIACAEDGTFGVAVSSDGDEVSLSARAPGYAQKRGSAAMAGPGSKARIDFTLPREFRVTGVITDPEGRPLEGVVVTSFMTSFSNRAISDERGRYVLHHLDPGRPNHIVFARHESYVEARSEVKTKGNAVTVDFQLSRGVRVEGRVTDADGRPLEGASLYIGFSPSACNRLDALAKDEGHFVFPVVEPGSQTLVASRPGYAPTRRVIEVPSDGSSAYELDVALSRGRAVRGIVRLSDGTPVAGAYVSWRHGREYIDRRLVTAADGTFAADHLPAAALSAEVWGTTFQRLEQDVPDGEKDVSDLVLTVRPSAKIAGRVVDAKTGEPLDSFLIRFVRADPEEGDTWVGGYSATWGREGHRFTDTDGYWNTAGEQLTAGGVTGIEVSASGYATKRHGRVFARVGPNGEGLVTRMERGGRLVGTVVDESDLRPIGDVVIKLYDDKHPLRSDGDDVHDRKIVRTDSKGHFRVEDLGAQDVYLDVEHPDYAPRQVGPIRMESGGEFTAGVIKLGQGGSVAGKAADDRGLPLAGVRVEAHMLSTGRVRWGRSWRSKTDSEGRFRFDHLPPGSVTIWRYRPRGIGQDSIGGGAAFSTRIEVKAGETTAASLAPSGSATLHGKVLYDGDLPEHLEVRASSRDPKAMHSRTALVVDGAFVFRRLEPGTYSVTCEYYSGPVGGPRRRWEGAARMEIAADEVGEIELPVTVR